MLAADAIVGRRSWGEIGGELDDVFEFVKGNGLVRCTKLVGLEVVAIGNLSAVFVFAHWTDCFSSNFESSASGRGQFAV